MTNTVSILETGTIRIRPSHRTQSAQRPVALRRLKVVLGDRNWTEPLPINTYLIDHPDGPILFDTGESPHTSEKGWLPWWQPFFHRAVDIKVAPEEGIGARLRQRGLAPEDLQAVVVSHLHHDHGDGLGDLARARVLVTDDHWDFYRKPLRATVEGAVPQHWPKNFQP
ncbi:MBL fold metallo-hydrolase [Arcanobacterium haemolyticum]|nr:MBL fold metallo-hydrolase [Arcanobacterium haemolyticum]